MNCVYILQSETTQHFYVGSTNDFERRLSEHGCGHCLATRGRGPWRLVYKEEFESLAHTVVQAVLLAEMARREIQKRGPVR